MLRLKIRVRRIDGKYSKELIAIANSGFVGFTPEIVLPFDVIEDLKLNEVVKAKSLRKITGMEGNSIYEI